MNPNFKSIDIKTILQQESAEKRIEKNDSENQWITAEQIPVKPLYTKADWKVWIILILLRDYHRFYVDHTAPCM